MDCLKPWRYEIRIEGKLSENWTTWLEVPAISYDDQSEETVLVGESGLHTRNDVQRMIKAGVDAVLVGTHFMKEPDPGLALQQFKKFI